MTIIIPYDPSMQPALHYFQTISYFSVASFAAVVYDWSLTFGQEVELIWRQHWSLMTILYLSVRYLGMPVILNTGLEFLPSFSMKDVGCTISISTANWMSIVVNAMLSVIIIARLYAMYQHSRMMLIFLVVVYLSVTVAVVIIFTIMMNHDFLGEEAVISGIIHMCMLLGDGLTFWVPITWILGTVCEVLAMCLAIRITVKHFKELQRVSTRWTIEDCFVVLLRTHIFYFAAFAMVSCLHLGTLSIKLDSSTSMGAIMYSGLLEIAQAVQMFVLGPRLILGVREYHANLINDADTGTEMHSIVFQERVHIMTSHSV